SEIDEIEEKVNSVIQDGLEVREKFLSFEEAKSIHDLSKLPNNFGESIRIIEIGSFDSCPCIGQHVNNTNEIGKFKIVSSSYNNGILRIRFRLYKDVKEN
ncbi:MAG: hypothetical protein R3250_08095, partial [Melioribacteraceae bacterium]|nr:hypothetical protein [Melioribacteraceae bacterium]